MQIRYGQTHKWVKQIQPNILADFGTNNAKKITRLLATLDAAKITYTFSALDQAFLDWFIPLYRQRIQEKDNPTIFDIFGMTLGKANPRFPYYALAIYENGIPIGGTIFTLRTYKLSIAFRSYLPKWQSSTKIACSPALLAEYLITKHAQDHHKLRLVHGSDRNPYGQYASIGVAIFKLSVGCYPVVQKNAAVHELDTATVDKNILLLAFPIEKRRITDAYFITTKDTAATFEQVTKYASQLRVHTIYRPDSAGTAPEL